MKITTPILLLLACFALSPTVRAQLSPAPDGGYPNENTAEGTDALFSLTTGTDNTASGFDALYNNTTGSENTATGPKALWANTTGFQNTATGSSALQNNKTGSKNTANGALALAGNTTGSENTATGLGALQLNTAGFQNTATGIFALNSNAAGHNNTATGYSALEFNTGNFNTATGSSALFYNTTGTENTANGYAALFRNTTTDIATGNSNTATGASALYSNTTGSQNTATGRGALYTNSIGNNNTAEGHQALYYNTGSGNTGLGVNAGSMLTTGSGNVCIGSGVLGVAGESNTTRIRNVYSSVASSRAVYVNSDNKIGTLVSSRRFKDEIKPMDKASETILALKPVTFRYKKEIEPNGAIMFGLIAEEVENVDPNLVTRNAKGETETVRYDAVNAMLLNEFLKAYRKVQAQEATITELKSTVAQQEKDFRATVAQLTGRLDEQASQIQKVSAQIEVNKPAPRTVLNNQ